MEKRKIYINDDLSEALLNGARIIAKHAGKFELYVLVEMPKGSEFRFELFHDYDVNRKSMRKAVSYNGHITSVKKKAEKDFWEREVHSRMQYESSQADATRLSDEQLIQYFCNASITYIKCSGYGRAQRNHELVHLYREELVHRKVTLPTLEFIRIHGKFNGPGAV